MRFCRFLHTLRHLIIRKELFGPSRNSDSWQPYCLHSHRTFYPCASNEVELPLKLGFSQVRQLSFSRAYSSISLRRIINETHRISDVAALRLSRIGRVVTGSRNSENHQI